MQLVVSEWSEDDNFSTTYEALNYGKYYDLFKSRS